MPASAVADPSILTSAQTPQTMQAWANLLDTIFPPTTNQSQSSSGTEISTSTVDSAANDPIRALLALLIPGAQGGVDNPQSKAMIAQLLQQFKEGAGGLSGIAAAGNSAGVYNSSTQGLLTNDAMARAVAAASAGIGTQQNQQQLIIAQLLATLSAGSRTTTASRATTGQQSTNTSKSGGGASAAGKGLLGAGAAAAAAKAIKNAFEGRGQRFQSEGDQEGDYPQFGTYGKDSEGDQPGDYPEVGYQAGNIGAELGTDFPPEGEIADSGNTISEVDLGGIDFDLGDFLSDDSSETNFDFIDGFSGIDFVDSGGDGEDIPDFTGGDF